MAVFVKGTRSKSRAERKPNVRNAYGTLGFGHCFKPRYETIFYLFNTPENRSLHFKSFSLIKTSKNSSKLANSWNERCSVERISHGKVPPHEKRFITFVLIDLGNSSWSHFVDYKIPFKMVLTTIRSMKTMAYREKCRFFLGHGIFCWTRIFFYPRRIASGHPSRDGKKRQLLLRMMRTKKNFFWVFLAYSHFLKIETWSVLMGWLMNSCDGRMIDWDFFQHEYIN